MSETGAAGGQRAARVRLRRLDARYAVTRLGAGEAIPDWADGPGFVSITRTDDELSIVCPQDRAPEAAKQDRDWVAYKLLGPFAFDETGIVLSVIRPLSENGLGIFIVSTFDGDHLLVKATDEAAARRHLGNAGHTLL
ncbi:MAG: ACT domain-containing protein [Mesorhizobium sp.]|uniref:ACT domain-containing protein n=1 Tax=Mesorhizobium sp. TaxID=1871066 RepID=UPI001AC83971|nr:ACT domain-containing protein [Mesorhizobium sp.]MBN9216432.1 ACT domain-containing protein [Mesorhizobium sp.]